MKKSRRKFVQQLVQTAPLVAGAPYLLNRSIEQVDAMHRMKKFSANDRINLAIIGAGGMGMEDAKTAFEVPGVEIVAACDLYKGHLDRAKKIYGQDIYTTMDYRDILNRRDIDAVIVATPDHWHRQISVDALMAGKAVYCEKPMVHHIEEGPDVIRAQKKSGSTFQVGSQGMSSLGNEKAKELFESGAIGQLIYAEGFWARNSPIGAWQYPIPKDASEETVDWDQYVSNTTSRKFDPVRFFRWRNYRDYGTGVSGDLFVHLFSSLHYIVSSMGPNKIQATGGLRYWKDGREVPDVLLGMFDYPKAKSHPAFNLSLRVNFVDGTSGSTYLKLVGSEGAMDVKWREVVLYKNQAFDPMDAFAKSKEMEGSAGPAVRGQMVGLENQVFKADSEYWGAHYDHFNNFFTSVRNGSRATEDAVFGYRAAAPALLCNDSYFNNEIIHWDPEKMKLKKG